MCDKKNLSTINSIKIFLSLICLCGFILFANGCGRVKVRGLVAGEGVVIYENAPLAWAMVSFTPESATNGERLGTAQTNAKGQFVLRTLGDKGILPGNYRISVTKYIRDEGKNTVADWKSKRQEAGFEEPQPEENILKVVSAIPENFSTTKKSGLTYTIESGGNRDIKIELK
ncbi:MAG: carboxypeptidase-like regulatory domain-containing protein [Planctomycetaceae bacterium]|nr:carboxypeptidase-like regulatory domain-containing protein [Planctomycetaceae bacterium]